MPLDPVDAVIASTPAEGAAAPVLDSASPSPDASGTRSLPAEAVPSAPVDAAPAPVLTTDQPSLLESAGKDAEAPAADVKPADEKPVEAQKTEAKVEAKAEEKPAAEPEKPAEAEPDPAAPVEYKFDLPVGITPDDTTLGTLSGILNEAKLPAELGNTVGAKLIDLHKQAMQAYADKVAADTLAEQHRAFNEVRKDWNKIVLADEEIGGAGHNTAMRAIARVRDRLMSTARPGSERYEQDRAEFETFLRMTGAGDHPAFLKILHRAAEFIDEPQSSTLPPNIRPAPDAGRPPGGMKSVLYDHPRSNGR